MGRPQSRSTPLDGVYVRGSDGALDFHELPPPTYEEVADVAARTATRVERLLEKRGMTLDDDLSTDLSGDDPVLTQLLLASAHGIDLFGERALKPTLRLVTTPPNPTTYAKPLPLAEVRGFNVHACTSVDGRDRAALERLCRYVARPPVAQERLHVQDDGKVRYDLKRVWADGTESIVMDPLSFMARLAALVPPPLFNLTRYHGVFASRSRLRAEVVVRPTHAPPAEPEQLHLPGISPGDFIRSRLAPERLSPTKRPGSQTPGRHPWAFLMRRTFSKDVTVCAHCGGPLRLACLCTDPPSIASALAREGLGPMPPPRPLPLPSKQLTMQI